MLQVIVYAALLQIGQPRMDPLIVRRAIEHSIGANTWLAQIEKQLQANVALQLGAGHFGIRGDERARQSFGQEFLISLLASPCTDVRPPADAFILILAPIFAARHDLPDALAKVIQFAGFQANIRLGFPHFF